MERGWVVERAVTGPKQAAWSLLGAIAALVLAVPEAAAGPCTDTTATAFTACLADAVDNFHIAKGVCVNLSDAAERDDCLAEAQTARKEDRGPLPPAAQGTR
jgi:hypothetical protein